MARRLRVVQIYWATGRLVGVAHHDHRSLCAKISDLAAINRYSRRCGDSEPAGHGGFKRRPALACRMWASPGQTWLVWIKGMTGVRTGETIPPGDVPQWRMISDGGDELNVHEGAV